MIERPNKRSPGRALRAPCRIAFLAACLPALSPCAALASQPDALRDPTEPPAAFRARPAAPGARSEALRPEHLVTVGDKRFLVWKGRHYGVGDSVQGARIERIEETEVWLRQDGELRKVGIYAGIQKAPAGQERAP